MTLQAIQNEWRQKYRTHTDLALEAHEIIIEREGPPEIPGVAVDTEESEHGTTTRVVISTEEGARAMGKMPGRYSTIEAPALRERDRDVLQEIAELIAGELRYFLDHLEVPAHGDVLVIGLGNWNSTPDALGPRTLHHTIVTRHFYHMATPEGRQGVRPVAGLSPGVLGITGVETAEIVQGLVRQINPAVVICIDALAARDTDRLATTIQIADAGIQPGSGVGNKRFGITRQTLGVPVIAVGVPTVVHALTVVADGLERIQANGHGGSQQGIDPTGGWPLPDPNLILRGANPGSQSAAGPGTPAWQTVPPQGAAPTVPPQGAPPMHPASETAATFGTGPNEGQAPGPMQGAGMAPGHAPGPGQAAGFAPGQGPAPAGGHPPGGGPATAQGTGIGPMEREVVQQLLEPYMGDLIMTPKEIDVLIEDVAETLAEALNFGLHDDLDLNRLILSAIRA